MNCKPGDLAIVVRARDPRMSHLLGRLVNVLSDAPHGVDFRLPDGSWHAPVHAAGDWLIEIVGAPVIAYRFLGDQILTRYGVISDSSLRPIRDQPGEDETLTWAGKPEGVTA